jgi:hypothetical protein
MVKGKGTPVFRIGNFLKNTRQDMHFLLVHSPSETYLRKGFLPSKIALFREKATLLFREYFILVLIWLIRDRIDAENHR